MLRTYRTCSWQNRYRLLDQLNAHLAGQEGVLEIGRVVYAGSEHHHAVATGRDYTDVAPTSGTYLGAAGGTLTATKRVGVTLA
jgi:hypothetical protein